MLDGDATPALDASPDEDPNLDPVVNRLYEVISFHDGGEPDWQGMREVFSSHARITRVTPEGIDYLDLATFQAMAQELVEVGVYTGFHEREIARKAHIVGHVAHVLSAYETKRFAEASDVLAQGINSIQLIREEGQWRVLSLCWDDARVGPAQLQSTFPEGGEDGA